MITRDKLEDSMRLYAVTDRSWLCGRTLQSCVANALAGGVTCVQLREKQASQTEIEELARSLKPVCARAGVPFLINDEVEIAKRIGTDGVHVGQDDMSCVAARKLLGAQAIIGVSVQTLDEALKAQEEGADYLGVGALFGTPTKPEAVEVSLATLASICAAVEIPVIGIGGINTHTLAALRGTGIDGIAVVSAIFAATDIRYAAQDLLSSVTTMLQLNDQQV